MLNKLKNIKNEILRQTTKEFRRKIVKMTLGITIVAIALFTVVPIVMDRIESKKAAEQAEQEVWQKSANKGRGRSASMEKIEIDFKPLETTENTYKIMEETVVDLANRARNFDGLAGVGSQVVVVGEEIPSDAFVTINKATEDGEEAKDIDKIEEIEGLHLASSLYLRDTYIGEFMGSDGTFGCIIAQLNGDELYVAPRLTFENKQKVSLKTNVSVEYTKSNISEDVYLSEIFKIMSTVYGQDWNDAIKRKEVLSSVSKYFTEDCKEILISQAEGIEREAIISIEPGFISVGTSEINSETIDRIYIQMELDVKGDKDGYVDFELKLNSNNRIYDIDVL